MKQVLNKTYIEPAEKSLLVLCSCNLSIHTDKLFETSTLRWEFYNGKREVSAIFMPLRYERLYSISICERGWQKVK